MSPIGDPIPGATPRDVIPPPELSKGNFFVEQIRVLKETDFDQTYPKGDLLSDRGDNSTVWNIAGSGDKVRKESQSHTDRNALITEAIAISRIHKTPVDVALVRSYGVAISVPKAEGFSTDRLLHTVPSFRERIILAGLKGMIRHIQTAHQSGVTVGEAKMSDIIMKGLGSKTTWVDYSSGRIMPLFSEGSLRKLMGDVAGLGNFVWYLDQVGGENELKHFLTRVESLQPNEEGYGNGLKLLETKAVRKFFGEEAVHKFEESMGQETLTSIPFIKGRRDALQKKTEEMNVRAVGIISFLKGLVEPARKWERVLDMKYDTWGQGFSFKAGEYIANQIADILGYEGSELNTPKGLPVSPRRPFQIDRLKSDIEVIRKGSFLKKSDAYSVGLVDQLFDGLQASFAQYEVEDWKEFLREAKSRISFVKSSDAANLLSRIEKTVSEMEKLVEGKDVSQLPVLEQQLFAIS